MRKAKKQTILQKTKAELVSAIGKKTYAENKADLALQERNMALRVRDEAHVMLSMVRAQLQAALEETAGGENYNPRFVSVHVRDGGLTGMKDAESTLTNAPIDSLERRVGRTEGRLKTIISMIDAKICHGHIGAFDGNGRRIA